ncbi:hypothetical protein BV22DRAFT_1002592 [Leucogyrophana mollusca]|uniref:Uncharacterized protein n=1 Tax=Leucogyrophana mollusca TaxID=85980 RepID=A0ACB8BVB2_9AGAM|nr:hypothetical protein BV22DRAFT_1002592 [Leucogyrophana mollusca]
MANARLLMPTVRSTSQSSLSSPVSPTPPTRSPRIKPTPARLIRSRSGSASATLSSSPDPNAFQFPVQDTGSAWLGKPYKFELVPDAESLQLTGYQMYAVEKWIVERTRPVTVLTVYTGDPQHTITVTALSPISTLTPAEAQIEWNSAVHHLRRDGARPKQTPLGTLMVTSLAHFRSDYTIVHIPNGDFLAARERLYTNINLLRMGCSGRSALTLEEPSETTKDRFKSTYFLSESPAAPIRLKSHSRHHTRAYSQPVTTLASALADPSNTSFHSPSSSSPSLPQRHPLFSATVLELVKLLQTSLAVCGMFPTTYGLLFDGLLCDTTVEGLQGWVAEFGEHCGNVEATERVADPTIVAALLSFVLATRNKLAAIGYAHVVPKDPFIHPQTFLAALSAYSQATTGPQSSSSTPLLPHLSTPLMGHSGPNFASVHTSPGATAGPTHVSPQLGPAQISTAPTQGLTYLSPELSKALTSAHDQKLRPADSRRVHRVLLSKLDREDNTDTEMSSEGEHVRPKRKGIGGSGGHLLMSGIENLASGFVGRGVGGAGGVSAPTADLGVFVRAVVGKGDREKGDKERGGAGDKGGDKDKDKADEGEKEKERIGGCLRALWSGKVDLVLKMRERAEGGKVEKDRNRDKKDTVKAKDKDKEKDRERLTSSDIDHDDSAPAGPAVSERVDGGKSNTEDDFAFGGVWSGRVQKKLELWAGINRSKRSVDLNLSPAKSGGRMSAVPVSAHSSSSGTGLPVYPEPRGLGLPSVIVSTDGGDEEDLLSSGQVSPISESRTHNPFTLGLESAEASSAYLGTVPEGAGSASEYDKRVSAFLMRRPQKAREESRVSSWSDPVSAWEGEDGMGRRGRGKAEGKKSTLGEGVDGDSDAEAKRRIWGRSVRRRHSFQAISTFKDIRVLRTEWMRTDVDLCGQLLVMRRREAHLQSVLACLEHLSTSLSSTNASLRSDYHAHQPLLSSLGTQTELLQQIEAARDAADAVTQQVQALEYESIQFRVDELWHTATPPREKVLELREKVFGMGGRRLVGGARVQWTLDGQERTVDAWGRTESEAEEEKRAGAGIVEVDVEDEEMEEAGVVEHTAMKPMWLLRFFTSWGARWGSSAGKTTEAVEVPALGTETSQSSAPHS